MKLASLIEEQHVFINSLTGTKIEIINQMVAHLTEGNPALNRNEILQELKRREDQIPSYIGHGVAIPHTRVNGITKLLAALATFPEGVDWGLPGKDKVYLVFLILSPGNQNTLMLQSLAAISKVCQSRDNRDSLCKAKSPARLMKMIEETGVDVKKSIAAADVMRTEFLTLRPEMTLREAAEMMSLEAGDGFPVINADGALVGELSSAELVKVGMMPYVDLLSDDSFLTNFEPFEQYFNQENQTTVREIMNTELLICPPRTPIIKVAHNMVQQGKDRVFICSEKKLEGIIYSKDILTRVLHL